MKSIDIFTFKNPLSLWELVLCPLILSTSFASAGSIWTLVSRFSAFQTKVSCTDQRTLTAASAWARLKLPPPFYSCPVEWEELNLVIIVYLPDWCSWLLSRSPKMTLMMFQTAWYDFNSHRDSSPSQTEPRWPRFLAASRSWTSSSQVSLPQPRQLYLSSTFFFFRSASVVLVTLSAAPAKATVLPVKSG